MNNQLSATEQPDPIANERPAIWELVIGDFNIDPIDETAAKVQALILRDMFDRDAWGRSKYKVPLQPFNGRDALVDLYQEILDAIVYTKQYLYETNDENFIQIYDSLKAKLRFVRTQIFNRDGK